MDSRRGPLEQLHRRIDEVQSASSGRTTKIRGTRYRALALPARTALSCGGLIVVEIRECCRNERLYRAPRVAAILFKSPTRILDATSFPCLASGRAPVSYKQELGGIPRKEACRDRDTLISPLFAGRAAYAKPASYGRE